MQQLAIMQQYQCRNCLHTIQGKWQARCQACGCWESFVSGNLGDGQPAVAKPLSTYEGQQGGKIQTGIPQLDFALCGGFVPGMTSILIGEYGLGKSTLALQAAFWIGVRAKRQSLYVSGEEGGAQVLERCNRLGLNGGWIQFVNPADVGAVRRYLMTGARPPFIVVDSLQCLDDPLAKGRDERRQWRAFKGLMALCHASKAASLVLSQVNARGRVKGGPAYAHEADGAVLKIHGQENSPVRNLEVLKNRDGKSKFPVPAMLMTAEGLK
jgi:DNA repair protein RadA/Sms